MNLETTIRRAQVYGFLSSAFLYPNENWTEEIPLLRVILAELQASPVELPIQPVPLPELQAAYRRAFGATGSLCYETEYGLPHEFRQSQEMADLNGFYQAFGFTIGGPVRERPDHLAVELEFMYALALKEAYAIEQGLAEPAEICLEAQRKFLQGHLGHWIDWFAQSLALTPPPPYIGGNEGGGNEGVYPALGYFTAAFIKADAARLGVQPVAPGLAEIKHTPFDPDPSCAVCPAVEMMN
jgi:nitrate reductase assembly molybdenum cofactor insertion protein NarJ